MAWTFCTSAAAISEAGVNANSTIVASGSTLARWSNQVENAINAETRHDWIADYANLGTNFKEVLADTAATMIGNKIIKYDMTGYLGFVEAQTILDVNRDTAVRNLGFLKDKSNQEKIT